MRSNFQLKLDFISVMARSIRKPALKRDDKTVPYVQHKFDKYYRIYYKPRGTGKKRKYSAYIRYLTILVYGILQMNAECLMELGLSSLNWKYIPLCNTKKELELEISRRLYHCRICIGMMINEKGMDPDFGYCNLYMCDDIMNANWCYKKCEKGGFYYGDPKDRNLFLMREKDAEYDGVWEWKNNKK